MTTKKRPVKKSEPVLNQIHDCKFIAVEWDYHTIETVSQVAKGLTTCAEALGTLARLFASQNVKFNSMLSVSQDKTLVNDSEFKG